MIRIYAISGSLRLASSNTALLRAAAILAPNAIEIMLCDSLGKLPHFNPDLEGIKPQPVKDFQSQLRTSDAVLIASPEYAHGITGVLKNALDWVVGSGEFINKPVALINASARAQHAHESLKETITTMMAYVVPEASLTIPLPNNEMDVTGIIADPLLSTQLSRVISALAYAVSKTRVK